ncbi:MAG: phenylalanine--tRNA ligase beta subunit-related protein, partial [Gemmatimonadota bacterium]|nr:phenylalanine--tRNA ligase beta subunit-related protein [Gemmatimonadota bacterium]
MYFQHSGEIWRDFPELVAGVLFAGGIDKNAAVGPRVATFTSVAEARLATATESELLEIQAWRRAFARMGLKPTQYRCASESLLRRFRKEQALPRVHPLIDLCNALSLAFAIPILVLDTSRIVHYVEVRYASGAETYMTFSGEIEHPDAHEVIFADDAGRAHARRWTNRQSGHSAVRDTTTDVLIVVEALHESASVDVERLVATITDELNGIWS